jgi:uncharacterized lipoprotein YajG
MRKWKMASLFLLIAVILVMGCNKTREEMEMKNEAPQASPENSTGTSKVSAEDNVFDIKINSDRD